MYRQMTEFDARLRRLHYRAWHRGTREADYVVGGFFDQFHATWTASELTWFEDFLEEQDVDILGWAMRTTLVPQKWQGAMMTAFQQLDYVKIAP
jgi:antitoxin CptB